jgi:protein TonB
MAHSTRRLHPNASGTTATASSQHPLPDRFKESLDELSRIADDLVDGLGETPHEALDAAENAGVERDPAAWRETLDELGRLALEEETPPAKIELQVGGDRGKDLDCHLDSLFTPPPPPSAPVSKVIVELKPPAVAKSKPAPAAAAVPTPQAAPRSVPQTAAPAKAPAVARPAEPAAAGVPSPKPPAPTAARPVTEPVAVARGPATKAQATPAPTVRAATPVAEHELPVLDLQRATSTGQRMTKAWVVAAGLFAVALAGGLWLLRSARADRGGVEAARLLPAAALPDAPASSTPDAASRDAWPPLPEAAARTTPDAEPAPREEPVAAALQADEPVPAPRPRSAVAPKTSAPAVATTTVEKQPVPPKEPAPREVAPAPVPVPAPVPAPQPELSASPEPTPGTAVFFFEPAPDTPAETLVAQARLPEAPQPEIVTPPVAAPVPFEAPVALDAPQPTYPAAARKLGERGTIVLNVLVSEQGKAVRVVVEEGLRGSAIEAAAIDTVLRWTYRPAQEHGQPVRAWTTETFTFP